MGPIPIIYSEQPEQVRSELEQYPELFSAEINCFMTRYEHLGKFKKKVPLTPDFQFFCGSGSRSGFRGFLELGSMNMVPI